MKRLMHSDSVIATSKDDSESYDNSGLWSSDSLEKESLEIGDKINYWLTIHVWGDDSTMQCSKVVKILSAKEIYEPHLYLENGDTVLFGSKFREWKKPSVTMGLGNIPL